VSGLNSAILRTLAECSVLVRLRVAIARLRSCRLSAVKEDSAFDYAAHSMLRGQP